MSAWKELSRIVANGVVREFLDSLDDLPLIVQLAYASALTIIQLRLDERLEATTLFFGLCFYFEQDCGVCSASKEGRCAFAEMERKEALNFAKKIYEDVAEFVSKEYFEDGDL